MAHKRARKSGRSTSPESDASPPPVAQKSATKKRPAPPASEDDSSVVEISPPPKKKVKKVAPGSPGFDSLPAVSTSAGLKSSLSMGKRLTFGSIKPDAPSPSPKAKQTDLQSPLSITKDKRIRRPSAKVVYMADESEDHSSDAEPTRFASPSKNSFTPASATASSSTSIGLHKGKGQPTDARSPSPATSGEEDHKLTPKAKPSVKPLSKGATPLRHRQLKVVSESEPDVVAPTLSQKPTWARKQQKQTAVSSEEEHSEPLSKGAQRKKVSYSTTPASRSAASEPLYGPPSRSPRKTPTRIHHSREHIRRSSPDPDANSTSNDESGLSDGLPRYITSGGKKTSKKPRRMGEKDSPTEEETPKKVKSEKTRAKSPAWDIEEEEPSKPAKAGRSSRKDEKPKELEELPPFNLLPYTDKPQGPLVMLDSDAVLEVLEEPTKTSLKAAIDFVRFGPFVNLAQAPLDAVDVRYQRLTIAGQRNPAVSFLSGNVVTCNIAKPKASTRENVGDSRSIGITPFTAQYRRYIAYIASKFAFKSAHGPIYDSSTLLFSTRKEGAAELGISSEPGTPSAPSKFYTKQAAPQDTSHEWYSKAFPVVLSFGDDVPIYDVRRSTFSFEKDGFDALQHFPQYLTKGSRPVPKDLPVNSLVTIAHTVGWFNGEGRKLLSLNVQFILYHGDLLE